MTWDFEGCSKGAKLIVDPFLHQAFSKDRLMSASRSCRTGGGSSRFVICAKAKAEPYSSAERRREMARGRSRYQKGRVVSTEAGGWEIHYNVYVTDPATGKPKRRHRSRVVGY